MSNVKRVVEYHINRLKDKRAEIRLQAVKELELLADADALGVLRELYEHDEDADVRKAAQYAGRSIYLKTRGESK